MSIDHAIAKIEAEMPRYPSSDAIHNVRTLLRIFQADGNGKSRTGYETFVFDMIARDIRESRADDLARDVKHIFEHVSTLTFSNAQLDALGGQLYAKYRYAVV